MRTTALALAATWFLAAGITRADDQEPLPVPNQPPPRMGTVVAVDKQAGTIEYEYSEWRPVQETVTQTVIEKGKRVQRQTTVMQYLRQESRAKFLVKEGTVRKLKGQALKESEVWTQLKPQTPILTTRDGKKLDPYYTQFYAPQMLVLVKDE